MTPELPTPLVEAAINDSAFENKNHPHTDWVPASFARNLERCLAVAEAALRELAYCEQDCSSGNGGYVWGRPKGHEVPCKKCEALAQIATMKGGL